MPLFLSSDSSKLNDNEVTAAAIEREIDKDVHESDLTIKIWPRVMGNKEQSVSHTRRDGDKTHGGACDH
jgi:hypothetical protein